MFQKKHLQALLLLSCVYVTDAFALDFLKNLVAVLSLDDLARSTNENDPTNIDVAVDTPNVNNNTLSQDLQTRSTTPKKPVYELREDLTQSTIAHVDNGVIKAFFAAEQKAETDLRYPLIGHLIRDNSEHFWEGLLSYGFHNKKFTEKDLWWVIRQPRSSTSPKMREQAELLFASIVLNTKSENKAALLSLMDKLWIKPKADEGNNEAADSKKRWGNATHSEKYNMFAALVEYNHVNELGQIFENLPKTLNHLFDTVVCTQEEWVSNTGSFFNPKHNYEAKTYNFIPWLMRKAPKTNKSILAKESRPLQHYVAAAQEVVKHIRLSGTRAQKADKDFVSLVELLKEEGYLDK